MDLPDFFGIDIGSHSIKVAQVKREGNNAQLLKVGSLNTEVPVLLDDSDSGADQLAEQLKQLKESAGISTVNCVAAVPESPIFSRLLTVPKVEDEKLKDTVHWELKPLIPTPMEEVDVAFLEIGERQVNNQPMIDLYVVAAPKLLTEKFKRITEKAGLNLIALETESLANTRAVTFNYETEADIMICDFGATSTDIVLARAGVPVYAHTISTGSDALTKAIAADYGLDVMEAEKYKRAFGLKVDAGEGKIAKAIDPIMQIIVGEVSRTLTYFRQKIGESQTKKVYMCGDAASLPGLSEYLNQSLGLEPIVVDPTTKVSVADSVRSKLNQVSGVGLTVAIGAGLKEN